MESVTLGMTDVKVRQYTLPGTSSTGPRWPNASLTCARGTDRDAAC
jgi:hypothetical protein